MKTLILVVTAWAMLSIGTHAGPTSYVCQLEGHSPAPGQEWLLGQAMESTLAIDRTTARGIHPVLGTTSFNRVHLLHPGSPSSSFKAFADDGGYGNVVYYQVAEFAEGDSKPLLVISDGISYWGTCQ